MMAFLNAPGLSPSAAALRDDLLLSVQAPGSSSGGGGGGGGDAVGGEIDLDVGPSLPPLRLPSSRRRLGGDEDSSAAAVAVATQRTATSTGSDSSSSDAFHSWGSSGSELINPYAIWSPAEPTSEAASSSGRLSEFGTAREYNNYWYDEQFAIYHNESIPGQFHSEDKFIMSIDPEQKLEKQEGYCFGVRHYENEYNDVDGGCEGCVDIYSCPFPLCDCCQVSKETSNQRQISTIYSRYEILDDQTERLVECGEDEIQLKIIDAQPEAVIIDGELLKDQDAMKEENTVSKFKEKELHMLNPYGLNTVTSTNKYSQQDAEDTTGLGNSEPVVENTDDARTVGPEKEDSTHIELEYYNQNDDELEVFNLRIIHRRNRTGFEENKEFQIVLNSVIAGRYYITEHIGSAAFSNVVQAHDLQTGIYVCLKIIKNDKEFFDQSLDEIKLLKFVNKYDPADEHHILRLYDYFYYKEHLFIVTELLRANLYEFQKYNREAGSDEYYTLPRIQSIARQCLESLQFLHRLGIIHCDLKPENIVIKSYTRCEVKIIDLGSSCFESDNLSLYVQSRSYRSPEVILGIPYDHKIDIWSLGCILAELYTGDVLFPNDSVPMILARMIGILGPIDMDMLALGLETSKYFTDNYDLYHQNEETDQMEYLMPERSSLSEQVQASDTGFLDFLSYLLQVNPRTRPAASEALQHSWLSFSYQ